MESVEPTVDPSFSLGPMSEVSRLRNEVNSLSIFVHTLSSMNQQTYKELKKLRQKLENLGVDLSD